MTELEQALIALGRELEFPPQPDLVPAVRERLERRRRLSPRGRAAALAFAVLVVAVGIAMAVPPARSAILRFFHIGAVTIERVDTLPPARERPLGAGLGDPLSRAAAEARAGFRIALPAFRGAKPRIFYAQPGLIATLLRVDTEPVLLAELKGDQLSLGKKLLNPETRIEDGDVGQYPGMWLTGARHVIMWQRPGVSGVVDEISTRVAGNVLVWLRGGTTLRLEGDLSKAKALALARKITP